MLGFEDHWDHTYRDVSGLSPGIPLQCWEQPRLSPPFPSQWNISGLGGINNHQHHH